MALDLLGTHDVWALGEQSGRIAGYLASASLGALAWSHATHRLTRAVLAIGVGITLATQALAWRHFGAVLDVRFVRSARAAWVDVWPVLSTVMGIVLVTALLATVLEALALSQARRKPSKNVSIALACLAGVGLWLGPPPDRATPEIRLALSVRALLGPDAERPRGTVSLPPIRASKREQPSVLLVVTESIRAVDYCSAPQSVCAVAPEVNALLPGRIPLRELRAAASYTAISMQAIATSQSQLGSREEIALAPTMFDFLRAARADTGVHTAYFGSHHKQGVWERGNVEDSVDTFVSQDVLEQRRGSRDRVIVDDFVEHVGERRGSLFAMLHLYGTHAPYFAAADMQPFQPATQSVSWETLAELHNQYKNAILTQDRQLARALRAFIDSRRGPWVILFTSDHGEAFGEHHAIHHGQNLYDEQIHVPGFVAFGAGALSEEQRAMLAARAERPTSHMDILPTVLDLYGIWDSLPLRAHRTKMHGSSWLRAAPPEPRAIPITNCTTSMPCPINSWGMLGDRHALIGQGWDADFRCLPLDDSGEEVPEGAECAGLRAASRAHFATKPNGKPNGKPDNS